MKLILFIHAYDLILYINCVFFYDQVGTLIAVATFFIVEFMPTQKSGERLQDHLTSVFVRSWTLLYFICQCLKSDYGE